MPQYDKYVSAREWRGRDCVCVCVSLAHTAAAATVPVGAGQAKRGYLLQRSVRTARTTTNNTNVHFL